MHQQIQMTTNDSFSPYGKTPLITDGSDPADIIAKFESDWLAWVGCLFPTLITHDFAAHHVEFWEWAWAIRKGERPRPFTAIWPRGGAKSQSAELAVASLGARGLRRYFIVCSSTQDRADAHVQSIGDVLESKEMAQYYPAMADRAVGKFGTWKGWRRNRLHTRSGFIIDALGLDVASRGMKVGNQRPDGIVIDDVDDSNDSPETTARMIETLTRRILPATTNDAVIIAIQNLIHSNSIFAQLVDGRATFLADRIVSGPIPAVRDLTYETRVDEDGRPRTVITGGEPTWSGLDMQACQNEITKEGITVFLSELQHVVPEATGGMFDNVTFRRCTPDQVPPLDKVVCWVDPAVTDNDESDAMGIQIDGIARDGVLYRLWSWEKRGSPLEAIKLALRQAEHYGAIYVGIETDQGGDTWSSVYREARAAMGPDYAHLHMRSVKAGQGYGSKVHRASQMLADYERGLICHAEGTHHVLEAALIRFPRTKPYDLVDACVTADTPVLTREGWRPIEGVRAGDEVMTREGWRKVLQAGKTGRERVWLMPSTGLRATANHPVWTVNRGWAAFDSLGLHDMVLAWPVGSKLGIKDEHTSDIPMPRSAIIGCITPVCPTHGLVACIVTYTRMLMERSLSECMSTMQTGTPTTTTDPTSWLCDQENIGRSMDPRGLIEPRCWRISKAYEDWLGSGMGVPTDERGMSNMENALGMAEPNEELSVLYAANHIGRGLPDSPSSARRDALMLTNTIPTISSPQLARNVESRIYDANIARGRSVVLDAATFASEEIADVFNLEVQGCQEFFASGILVHNSQWSWRDLRKLSRPARATPATGAALAQSLSSPRRGASLAVPGAASRLGSLSGRGELRVVRQP